MALHGLHFRLPEELQGAKYDYVTVTYSAPGASGQNLDFQVSQGREIVKVQGQDHLKDESGVGYLPMGTSEGKCSFQAPAAYATGIQTVKIFSAMKSGELLIKSIKFSNTKPDGQVTQLAAQ